MSGARKHAIQISRLRWFILMRELARRGRGDRESGAFLLARTSSARRKVSAIVYFDDLHADALNGAVSIPGAAFSRLWELCEQQSLRVIADIHTHPGAGVQQSHIDAANPMVARLGHVGIIVPHFAQRDTRPGRVGFHIYQGDRTWTSEFGPDADAMIHRTWW